MLTFLIPGPVLECLNGKLVTRFCNNKQPPHINVLVDKSVYDRIYIYYI
ncbi:unnamed protein product [Ectocarpus sp. CCAP 1310/34]|nr:unnamed protein product [Ectocarpus sp. CCAP 1310/34]